MLCADLTAVCGDGSADCLLNKPLTKKKKTLHAGAACQAQSRQQILRRQSAAEESDPEEERGEFCRPHSLDTSELLNCFYFFKCVIQVQITEESRVI